MTFIALAPDNVLFINGKAQPLVGLQRRFIIRFHV